MGVEEVDELFRGDRSGHGNLGGIEIGEARAQGASASDDAGDAEAEIVGALVAEDLGGQAGRSGAGQRRIGGDTARQRGQEASGGGAEADAGDVDVDRGAVGSGMDRVSDGALLACLSGIVGDFGNHDRGERARRTILGELRAGET